MQIWDHLGDVSVMNLFDHLQGMIEAANSCNFLIKNTIYCNDSNFLDRTVWANSADPDQTAPRGAV